MEKVIHKLINEFTEGVDTYTHNGSTWLIFTESKQWVLDNLKGRFCVIQTGQLFLVNYYLGNIAFEDPKDATFYELKWS
jgi:hypothetical protein